VWSDTHQQQIRIVLQKHASLFRQELSRFNDSIFIPIPFKKDVDISDLKQTLYNMSLKDKKAIDEILDPLTQIGVVEKVPLGRPSLASALAFLVWRNNKPRLVVDLRRVNTKLYKDTYPLPRQDDIFDAMGGATVFSVLDMVKGFFQQPIEPTDR
jgi:hypothetical protein